MGAVINVSTSMLHHLHLCEQLKTFHTNRKLRVFDFEKNGMRFTFMPIVVRQGKYFKYGSLVLEHVNVKTWKLVFS